MFVTLAGCDAAESTAEKLVEESKQKVEQVARDTLSKTAKQINEQLDNAQEKTQIWLKNKDDEKHQEKPPAKEKTLERSSPDREA
jgi:vacuolar-type H+-ATPase subunit H